MSKGNELTSLTAYHYDYRNRRKPNSSPNLFMSLKCRNIYTSYFFM